jgi:hypothetical protein
LDPKRAVRDRQVVSTIAVCSVVDPHRIEVKNA